MIRWQQALQPGGRVVSGLVVTISTQRWVDDKQRQAERGRNAGSHQPAEWLSHPVCHAWVHLTRCPRSPLPMSVYHLTLWLWSWLASDSVSCIQTWFYWSEQYEAWTSHCSLHASHCSLEIQRHVKAWTEETGLHCEASVTCHLK